MVGLASCANCGAMIGVLPAQAPFVERVFAGGGLVRGPPGLGARFTPRTAVLADYRAGAPEAEPIGELFAEYRLLRRPEESTALVLVVLAAVVSAWAVFRIGVEPWLLVPACFFASSALLVASRARMLTAVHVADGVLQYDTVPFGFAARQSQRFAARDVRQLYVMRESTPNGELYELVVRKHDGAGVAVDRFLGPEIPLLLEALIERALGIPDEPQPGELDRQVPTTSRRSIAPWVSLGLVAGMLSTAVAVEVAKGRLPLIPLAEAPSHVVLEPSTPMTLWFHVELAFEQRESPGQSALPSAEAVPEVATVHVELVRDGQPNHVLVCNAHALAGAVAAIEEAGAGKRRFRVLGGMRGCSVRLEPGRWVVAARVERLPGAATAGLTNARLQPRFVRHLW